MAYVGAEPTPKKDEGAHGPGEGNGSSSIGPKPGRQVRLGAAFPDGVNHFTGNEGEGDVHESDHHGAGAESPDPSAVGTGIAPELAPKVSREPFG